MEQSTLKNLLREYSQKKIHADLTFEEQKSVLYKTHPKLQELETELNQLYLEKAKSILRSNTDVIENINGKIKIAQEAQKSILNTLNIDIKNFSPNYSCKLCNDTGYISNNYTKTLCSCIKQKLLDIEYNKSNISKLNKENFSTFNISLYSPDINVQKYNSGISPESNILTIKKISERFLEEFDNPEEKNLLFTGASGLGKTFLSNCIANEVLRLGKTVLYQTAPVMLDSIIDYKFDKPNAQKNIYYNVLNADLLIIDDLGTEFINSLKFSELFNIINTRLLNQDKITKTIISTNLSIKDLYNTYDERIVSRIIGNYNICRFFGDDIRLKKCQNK